MDLKPIVLARPRQFVIRKWQSPDALALREFSAMGMYGSGGLNLDDAPAARRLNAAAVDSGFFDVLGVPPLAGRTFTPEEDRGLKVIVIGFDLWRQA